MGECGPPHGGIYGRVCLRAQHESLHCRARAGRPRSDERIAQEKAAPYPVEHSPVGAQALRHRPAFDKTRPYENRPCLRRRPLSHTPASHRSGTRQESRFQHRVPAGSLEGDQGRVESRRWCPHGSCSVEGTTAKVTCGDVTLTGTHENLAKEKTGYRFVVQGATVGFDDIAFASGE